MSSKPTRSNRAAVAAVVAMTGLAFVPTAVSAQTTNGHTATGTTAPAGNNPGGGMTNTGGGGSSGWWGILGLIGLAGLYPSVRTNRSVNTPGSSTTPTGGKL